VVVLALFEKGEMEKERDAPPPPPLPHHRGHARTWSEVGESAAAAVVVVVVDPLLAYDPHPANEWAAGNGKEEEARP